MNIGTLIATIGGDVTPLKGALGQANAALNKFSDQAAKNAEAIKQQFRGLKEIGGSLKDLGGKMTLGLTLPIAAAGAGAFKMASDYEESLNKVRVAFKGNSAEVEAWSKTTLQSFGIAAGTALDMSSLFGDMSTSMGLSTGEASKMSTSLVGLAGDLASFKNIGTDQAAGALKGIFTGETESLKGLGIVMNETSLAQFALSQGIQTQIKDMTQAEKVQLRYAFVMEATKNSQGDFARTSGGAANQMRIFQESIKEVAASFGSLLLPVITPIIAKVNQFIQWVGQLNESQKKWVVGILAVTAAIGPLVFGIGYLIANVIPQLVMGFKAIGTAMNFLAANPIILIIAAVAALAIGIIALWKHCETFRAVVKYVAQSVSAFFQKAWIEIKMGAELMWLGIKTYFTAIPKLATAVWNIIKRVMSGEKIGDVIKDEFSKIFEGIKDEASGIKEKYNEELAAIKTPNYQEILAKEKAVQAAKETGEAAGKTLGETLVTETKKAGTPSLGLLKDMEAELKKVQDLSDTFMTAKGEADNNDKINALTQKIEDFKTKVANVGKTDIMFAMGIQDTNMQKIKAPEMDLGGRKTDVFGGLGADLTKIKTDFLTATGSTNIFTNALKSAQGVQIKPYDIGTIGAAKTFTDQNDILVTSLQNVDKEFEAAKNNAKLMGEIFDGNAVKAGLVQKQIDLLSTALDSNGKIIEKNIPAIEALVKKHKELADAEALTKSRTIDLGAMLTTLAQNTLVAVGEGLGAMLAGTADAGSLFKNILGIVADFMSSLGQALIAAGLASKAFTQLISNPFLAIAAGVALIALAGFVKGKLSAGPAGGGENEGSNISAGKLSSVPAYANGSLSIAPHLAMVGDNPNASRDPELSMPVSKLQRYLDTSGGQSNIPAVIHLIASGENLEAIINTRQKRNNNLR
jgi:hypothetical protein